MSFSFQPCILSHCSFSPRFLHESSRIFEEKKLQFGCFSYRKTTELQFFLLKERISSGKARANLNSQPKSTTIWAFDSVKRPNCCAFWLRIRYDSCKNLGEKEQCDKIQGWKLK